MRYLTQAYIRILPDKKTITGLITLPKPGIVALVLLSTFTGLYLGGRDNPDTRTFFWTLLGLGIATAGAAVLNNFLDRDIDRIMQRTKNRSLPSGSVSAKSAYYIGITLVIISLFLLKIYVSLTVTILTAAAVFIYVVLYTLYFKRTTPAASLIGGVGGALPPVIGYTATNHALDYNALALFLIIVIWQQPHFWALALKYREDYMRARVPMLPVAKSVQATKVRMFWYTLALLPVSVFPFVLGMAGIYYLASALITGTIYLVLTIRFLFSPKEKEMLLFFYSIFYLAVVFGMMIGDMI